MQQQKAFTAVLNYITTLDMQFIPVAQHFILCRLEKYRHRSTCRSSFTWFYELVVTLILFFAFWLQWIVTHSCSWPILWMQICKYQKSCWSWGVWKKVNSTSCSSFTTSQLICRISCNFCSKCRLHFALDTIYGEKIMVFKTLFSFIRPRIYWSQLYNWIMCFVWQPIILVFLVRTIFSKTVRYLSFYSLTTLSTLKYSKTKLISGFAWKRWWTDIFIQLRSRGAECAWAVSSRVDFATMEL